MNGIFWDKVSRPEGTVVLSSFFIAMNRGAILVYPPPGNQIKVSAYSPMGRGEIIFGKTI